MTSVQGLALFFKRKYASEFTGYSSEDDFALPDFSLGVAINPDKVKILKNNLIEVYTRINKETTDQPIIAELNKDLAFNGHWHSFVKMVKDFSEKIPNLALKDIVNISSALIQELNIFKNNIVRSGLSRNELLVFDKVITDTQNFIHKESKAILNIHDLKKSPTEDGTWNFGHGKNPTSSALKQKNDKNSLLKRLELENKIEEVRKKLGPYATEEEINRELKRKSPSKNKILERHDEKIDKLLSEKIRR